MRGTLFTHIYKYNPWSLRTRQIKLHNDEVRGDILQPLHAHWRPAVDRLQVKDRGYRLRAHCSILLWCCMIVFAFFVPVIFHYISYLVAFNTCIHCRHSERIINHPLAWLMCSATPINWMIRPMRSFVICKAHFFPLISVEHLHTWW